MILSHGLAQFHEHLVKSIDADDPKPGELQIENDVVGGGHDEPKTDHVDPTAGLGACQLELGFHFDLPFVSGYLLFWSAGPAIIG